MLLNIEDLKDLIFLAGSIPRKPRKSRNLREFSFSSQVKYSPPIITFVHRVNPYLQIFFRWVRKATFCRFCGFVVESESAESAEIFKSWRPFAFLYKSLEGTALILQITNSECLRGNATRINQFLPIPVSRDPCCYFSSEKLVWSSFLLVL